MLGPACLLISVLAFLPWYFLGDSQMGDGHPGARHPCISLDARAVAGRLQGSFGRRLPMFRCSPCFGGLGVSCASRISRMLLSAILFPDLRSAGGRRFRRLFLRIPPDSICVAWFGHFGGDGVPGVTSKKQDTGHRRVGAVFARGGAAEGLTMQMNSRENWPAAARGRSDIAANGRCIEVVPATSLDLYTYFCSRSQKQSVSSKPIQPGAALISSVYTTSAELIAAADRLRGLGFSPVQSNAVGGTTITLKSGSARTPDVPRSNSVGRRKRLLHVVLPVAQTSVFNTSVNDRHARMRALQFERIVRPLARPRLIAPRIPARESCISARPR